MAYKTGTASSHTDLLCQFKEFVTTDAGLVAAGQAWTVLRFADGPAEANWPVGNLNLTINSSSGLSVSPLSNYRIKVSGVLTVPSDGAYTIGIDCADSGEITIGTDTTIGWYGTHAKEGGFSHNLEVQLTAGTYPIAVNLACGTTNTGFINVGWKKPGDSGIATIPSSNFSGLTYSWSAISSVPSNGSDMQNLAGEKELILKAPGLSGSDSIYLGIKPYQNAGSDYYNWNVAGMTGFNSASTFSGQPGRSPSVYLPLTSAQMTYWFFVNGQRAIVVAKVSSTYQMMYLGKFFVYGLPSQYPYPVIVSATSDGYSQRHSVADHTAHNIGNPGSGSYMANVDGAWLRIRNRYQSSSGVDVFEESSYVSASDYGVKVWPTCRYGDGGYNASTSVHNPIYSSESWPNNCYTLLPLILNRISPANVYGEVDGVMWVSGHQNTSENVITVGDDQYICFQDISRTGLGNFLAVRMA